MSEPTPTESEKETAGWRRFTQFRLSTLLVWMAVCAVCCGLVVNYAAVRRMVTPRPTQPTVQVTPIVAYVPAKWEADIISALERPVDLNVDEVPLANVAAILSQQTGIVIRLDHRALDELGLGSDTPVTTRAKHTTLRSVLNILLHSIDPYLTWMVRDESLWITTMDAAEELLVTRVYDVADLITVSAAGFTSYDYDSLIECIQRTIEPESWEEVGGPASIAEHDADGVAAVVIQQTWQIHESITRLLEQLRRVRHDNLPARDPGYYDPNYWPGPNPNNPYAPGIGPGPFGPGGFGGGGFGGGGLGGGGGGGGFF